MSDARSLVEQIRRQLQPLEEKILRHRYLNALEEGRIQREALHVFAGQQYHIITSDLRSVAMMVARHGDLPSRAFLMNVLDGETAALEALGRFAAALGMSPSDLEAFEPLPAAHAYCAFMAWLSLYGTDAEFAAAVLVNFAAWGANCGRMSQALQHQYGLSRANVAFFDLFASLPPMEEPALAVVQGGLQRGVPPARIHRAARMLQAYELMYWDAMAEAAGV